jgi:hypothetical protein
VSSFTKDEATAYYEKLLRILEEFLPDSRSYPEIHQRKAMDRNKSR